MNDLENLFTVYILKSIKDGRYYFGHTQNIINRLADHNRGKVKSTKNRVPLLIHYTETAETKAEAYRRELFFKSFEGRKWLHENKII